MRKMTVEDKLDWMCSIRMRRTHIFRSIQRSRMKRRFASFCWSVQQVAINSWMANSPSHGWAAWNAALAACSPEERSSKTGTIQKAAAAFSSDWADVKTGENGDGSQ